MAKSELLNQGEAQPLQTYEGDYMSQNGDHVFIYSRGTNPRGGDEQVAAIRLDKGQSVKKVG